MNKRSSITTIHRPVANSLAVETGGQHVALNDYSRVIDLASRQSRNHYRISFQVARKPDGMEHEVEVIVNRKGVFRVRHQNRYIDLSPRERLLRQLKTSSNIPKTANQLPVAIAVHVGPSDGATMSVQVDVSVPMDRFGLLWDEGNRTGETEFFLAIYSSEGTMLSLESKARGLRADSGLEQVAQSFATVVPVGVYTVAVAALDGIDGRVGMDFTRIHPAGALTP